MITNIIITIGFSLFYAIWRRCYGGWDTPIWKKIFPKQGSSLHRWFWRIINIAAIFSISFFYLNIHWLWSIYVSLIMQFIFWDWSFGMYMGMGRHELPPNQEDIEEYNDQLFAPFLNWLIDSNNNRYGEFYDYLGMLFRFSSPGLLLFFVPQYNIGMCFLGTIIATLYLIEIRFKEKGINNFFTRNLAELGSGFFTGLFIVC